MSSDMNHANITATAPTEFLKTLLLGKQQQQQQEYTVPPPPSALPWLFPSYGSNGGGSIANYPLPPAAAASPMDMFTAIIHQQQQEIQRLTQRLTALVERNYELEQIVSAMSKEVETLTETTAAAVASAAASNTSSPTDNDEHHHRHHHHPRHSKHHRKEAAPSSSPPYSGHSTRSNADDDNNRKRKRTEHGDNYYHYRSSSRNDPRGESAPTSSALCQTIPGRGRNHHSSPLLPTLFKAVADAAMSSSTPGNDVYIKPDPLMEPPEAKRIKRGGEEGEDVQQQQQHRHSLDIDDTHGVGHAFKSLLNNISDNAQAAHANILVNLKRHLPVIHFVVRDDKQAVAPDTMIRRLHNEIFATRPSDYYKRLHVTSPKIWCCNDLNKFNRWVTFVPMKEDRTLGVLQGSLFVHCQSEPLAEAVYAILADSNMSRDREVTVTRVCPPSSDPASSETRRHPRHDATSFLEKREAEHIAESKMFWLSVVFNQVPFNFKYSNATFTAQYTKKLISMMTGINSSFVSAEHTMMRPDCICIRFNKEVDVLATYKTLDGASIGPLLLLVMPSGTC